ncbi:Aliphatic sulfonates import ATP-binding protein SsuB [Planctomycetes bacterium MalM25]|nr:Aliphatic sulfonates import ATP-binding protein SsuB [Planctomycetes bacterium MalM25]
MVGSMPPPKPSAEPTPPAAEPLVRLAGIGKAFGLEPAAIERIDLQLAPGEFACLVGPSGCGKSTLLRMLAGLAEPTSGRIDWAESPAPGRIGCVFQEPTLMPWARVWDNVALPLRLHGEGRRAVAERVDEALGLVGLADRALAFPRELSGGMKMRVSIARALVTRPRVLLMDEPFAALDEITRFRLNDDLLRLWREQALTVLFVTHSVYESVYLAQRVLVMASNPGRITAEIAVDEPYPRDESFRREASYGQTCGRVSEALKLASDQGCL